MAIGPVCRMEVALPGQQHRASTRGPLITSERLAVGTCLS